MSDAKDNKEAPPPAPASEPPTSPTTDANPPVPKNTVILHAFEPGKTCPNISPFVLKLETYLRMTGIPYEISTKKPFGPKGKCPWITLNGENVADSQLCIEFLNKKFEKNPWGNATEEQKALARIIRLALEEHFVWAMANWRWVKDVHHFDTIADIQGIKFKFMKFFVGRKIKNLMHDVGIGRHSYEEMTAILEEDLNNVSALLGNKQFILGDEPVEADCAIFGVLAQVVWAMPGSPYEKLVNEKLTNLKEYCIRIKEKFWADWDNCLSSAKAKEKEKEKEKEAKEKEASPAKEKEKAAEATPAPEPATAAT